MFYIIGQKRKDVRYTKVWLAYIIDKFGVKWIY
jgi:hypothetical protein